MCVPAPESQTRQQLSLLYFYLFIFPFSFFFLILYYLDFNFLQRCTALPFPGQAGVTAVIVTVFFGNYILSFVNPTYECVVSLYFYFCRTNCVMSKVIRCRQLGGIGIWIRLCRSSLRCRWCRLARRSVLLRSESFLFRFGLCFSLKSAALVLRGQSLDVCNINLSLICSLDEREHDKWLLMHKFDERVNPSGGKGNQNEYS